MNTITDERILAHLKATAEELTTAAPGYVQIRAVATWLPSASDEPTVRFVAYNEHTGHSPEFNSTSEAIEWVRAKAGGRTEADIIRAEIAMLEAKAAALESTPSASA